MATKKLLTSVEIETLIKIGFCQPKFYKRSVWNKAKAIMEQLVSWEVGVVRFDFGRGKGKYVTEGDLSIKEVANIYKARVPHLIETK